MSMLLAARCHFATTASFNPVVHIKNFLDSLVFSAKRRRSAFASMVEASMMTQFFPTSVSKNSIKNFSFLDFPCVTSDDELPPINAPFVSLDVALQTSLPSLPDAPYTQILVFDLLLFRNARFFYSKLFQFFDGGT